MSRRDCGLAGIIPALVTPATDDGRDVDVERAKALVTRVLQAGVHGLFAGASTGEAPLLNREQRIKMIDAVATANASAKVPLLAGVGAMNTNHAIEYAKDAEAHGANFVVALPMHFIKVSDDELFDYFAAIADSVSIPTLLYNYPMLTSGQNISPQLAQKLASSHNIVGIKDSSGDFALGHHYIEACGPGFAVFTGTDTTLLPMLSHGGAGTICGSANVIPEVLIGLYNYFCEGEIDDALDLQRKISRGSYLWKLGTFPAAVKAACGIVGDSVGPPFPPVHALGDAMLSQLKEGLGEHFDVTEC